MEIEIEETEIEIEEMRLKLVMSFIMSVTQEGGQCQSLSFGQPRMDSRLGLG